ncbi:polyribonucleotide nucleotidyltransferase [Tetragenococcus halophilus]|uniref:Polyribonucleotide nucleotidyltransferase n=1 Tax=Tetragenococcus halophilus (strain DSM 20338 / JCM 20259 / NCIMB 9735 / NBRC 12172) TaxID=945021 RepID=A0AAN1VQD9_TETHN|nr:polyribonucleotide nucleotidyltransferase [Tetragenococcus halophilus]QXN86546.1 polyribonucleotide nucleotidyltransferase [Tetragenococcus halophilus]WJS81601.1 polyribonucleotide nucleotidyltransferase [Tetragenococcus halophilus]BAK93887.1 polynucleotide phosphorylase [Tetragenococcus halophilus NBRC 12172]GBD60625.1 polynucleotide phosphorylase [Tetragenococcus halophilus subsp. halophilus]GBD80598.1 polynucleotide phosphorylase [Tetragenococcus halophilus subsp. halophilus]
MTKQVFETTWGGRPLQVEVGQLAKQANGAVLVRYGETVVLSAVVASKEAKGTDFFPLTINYEEKMYAVGKIPGGFIKREGRPSTDATLTARLIDRPIRPMFAEGFRNEVQVTNTVMSVEQDCSPAMAAMLGSSLALSISDIPFEGPIAGVEVGRVNGEYILNPTVEQHESSDIDLTVAGTSEAINMVESGAQEVTEADMLGALMFGQEAIQELVAFEEEVAASCGKEKMDISLLQVDEDLQKAIYNNYYETMKTAVLTEEKLAREDEIENVKTIVKEAYEEQITALEEEASDHLAQEVNQIAEDLEKDVVRELITIDKIRPDGRKVDEIRSLSSEVGLLPRAHGSGLFTRGQTQALSACTLAPLGEHQVIDGLGVEESKRFIHHYNFPKYSVGSTGRAGSPGRREIGHGALGERALSQIIPSEAEFPYTIRLVAEVLESNGSSSQASICAGTLALMDAGVPIKAPVAGIAMGLVSDGENYTILTDIQGMEDHLGDMDFKVAGTKDGITALQMDIKIQGITEQILREALAQAKQARMEILQQLTSTIAQPKEELSPYAPKIEMMSIDPEKIKDVIGKGGDVINGIIDETGVKIDIDQEGNVSIASSDAEMIKKASGIIKDLTKEIKPGEVYLGKVVRIEKFGAFVNIAKGKDGLVHISQIAKERINKVEDVLHVGDEVLVKVTEIDKQGRINLSRKAMLKDEEKTDDKKDSKSTKE